MLGPFGTGDQGEPGGGHIRWPAGFSPECSDAWADGELVINAAPAIVFSHLVTAGRWEHDFSGIRKVRVLTPGHDRLEADSTFEFEMDGLRVCAQVTDFVACSRLAWFGQGIDISVYHAWAITRDLDRSRVAAGFAARGAAAIALREANPDAPRRALGTWVAGLKAAAERTEP
jgi:hypothetical protein